MSCIYFVLKDYVDRIFLWKVNVCYELSIMFESTKAIMWNGSMLEIVREWLVMNDFVKCHMPTLIDLCCNWMEILKCDACYTCMHAAISARMCCELAILLPSY